MAITLVDLTGNVADILASEFDPRRTKVWIETNVAGDMLIDTDTGQIRLGSGNTTVEADGSFTLAGLIATNSADVEPAAFQYRLWVDYADAASKKRTRQNFGWFSITANTDLSDVVEEQYVPPAFLTAAVTTLQGYVDDAEDARDGAETAQAAAEAARDDAVDISGISVPDALVAALIDLPGSDTAAALFASGVAPLGKQAGVDPTGVAECAGAIQTAFAAFAALGVTAIAIGTFLLGSAVALPDGLTMNADGATFIATSGAAHTMLSASNPSDITINGLTLDLNKANVTTPGSGVFGTDAVGISLTGSGTGIENIVLRDVTIRNGYQWGLYVNPTGSVPCEVTLSGGEFTGCNIGAVVADGTAVSVRGGRYHTNVQDGLYLDGGSGHTVVGVNASTNGRHGIVTDTAATDFTISGCRCNGNGTGVGEGIGIVTSVNTHHWTISGNTCVGNKTAGIQIDPNNGTSTMIAAHGTLAGNVCSGSTAFHGIYVSYARYVTVVGNICSGNAHSGLMLVTAEAMVSGNEFVGNTNSGLYLGYTGGTTPTMGDHVIGANQFSGNGATITVSSPASQTPSRYTDARFGLDVDDSQQLRFGSSSTTWARLERSGTKRLRFNDTDALFDVSKKIEFNVSSGNTATLGAVSTTMIQRMGTGGLQIVNNAGAVANVTFPNAGGLTMAAATRIDTAAATTATASLRVPHGAAPTSPVNGDMWTTTAGLFVRINGVTVGPLS